MSSEQSPLDLHAKAAIQTENMLSRGDRLIVGLSGGADSVALLHFLYCNAELYDIKLTAVHLNHSLRGEESDRDEQFVRELCKRLDIPLIVETKQIAQIAAQSGQSIEQCAREVRYDFFCRAAHQVCADKIATAHTLSDSIETVLINLARGTALRGLCGIPPVREFKEYTVIRPLIRCTREQIEAYCSSHSLDFVTDSTNLEDEYTRNRIRHNVVPALSEGNSAFSASVQWTMDALAADDDYMNQITLAAEKEAESSHDCYNRDKLVHLHTSVRRRVLNQLLRDRDIPQSRQRIVQLESLLKDDDTVQLNGSWYCKSSEHELLFYKYQDELMDKITPIQIDNLEASREVDVFSDKKLKIKYTEYEEFEENHQKLQKVLKNALDYDKIEKIVKIRGRISGDSVRLAGRGCTKTLKKLCNEAGLDKRERTRMIVLEDKNGLLWVEGFGVAESVAIDKTTRRALFLEVVEPCTD